jgi:hypothetical protein
MSISNFFQFIFGFILGISLVAGSAVSFGYILLTRMSGTPPKPVFTEESNPPKQDSQTNPNTVNEIEKQARPQVESIATEVEEPLPKGAYKAIVTWEEGLSMRSEPKKDGDRIDSALYNQEIIVLEESEDKLWQKIRLPKSDREGWIKAGNIRKI